jgi:hypothetical protein
VNLFDCLKWKEHLQDFLFTFHQPAQNREIANYIGRKTTVFWDITPCTPLKVNRRFGRIYRLHLQGRKMSRARNQLESCLPPPFTLVSCSAYSSTKKMEAICCSETSVDFQRTTRRYIAEDGTLHNHHCGNLKSYILEGFYVKSE